MGDEGDDRAIDTSTTARHVERESADTAGSVSTDAAAQRRWHDAQQARYERSIRSEPDPWDQGSSGPSVPIGDVDDQVWRDTGAGIIDAVRQGLESVPGIADIIRSVDSRPMVSEADTGFDTEAEGIVSFDDQYVEYASETNDQPAFDGTSFELIDDAAVDGDWGVSPDETV